MLRKISNLMVVYMERIADSRFIAMLSVFIAVVFVFTVLVAISIPATHGFWNVGEAGVYIVALIGGYVIGGVAGGVGSALADIFLGYAIYAPGTLVIKGAEGFVVGWLYRSLGRGARRVKYVALVMGLVIAGFLVAVFSYFGSAVGSIDVELAMEPLGITFSFEIHYILLIVVVLLVAGVAVVLILWGEETAIMIFSCLVGGMVMVAGYFLYETLILGTSIALVEILPNFMQAFIGIIIAIPVVKKLREMGVIAGDKEFVG